jgi:AP-3 complex subunit mu
MSVNPLFAFSFLDAFLATLKDYLGEVTETSIKDNFDIVYMVGSTHRARRSTDVQLIEEMLDEGHPMTMETAMLKDIVLPPTLMRKILNVAGVPG